jgi:hypothetical protein
MSNPLPAHPQLVGNRGRARQIAHPTRRLWADPAHVRDHVRKLLATSTFQAIGKAANVSQMTVWEIANGARPVIKTETAAALLAVTPGGIQPRRVDATGSMWRLRSLVAMGHTTGRIATALGASRNIAERLIRGERATVAPPLRDDITRLFGAWWDKRPPSHTAAEKTAARKARQRAAVHNWPPPAALDEDELDRPGYTPTARWAYAHGSGIADNDPLGKNTKPNPGAAAGKQTSQLKPNAKRAEERTEMNDAEIEQQQDAMADTVLACDELGEYYATDDPLNDPVNRQIFEEDMDRRLEQQDIADKSLMDTAAAMRSPRPKPGLYQLHACLDDSHLDVARQLIADAQPQAEAG